MLTRSLTFVLCLMAAISTNAQLKTGQTGPALNITHWISNVPENKSLQDKLLVVDFWATWCKPCIASVPHMNELVKANEGNKDLVFLSLSDEDQAKIEKTLAKVSFASVVVTDTTGQSFKDYRIHGIPHCVLLDDNMVIKWSGHPMELTENMLKEFAQHQPVSLPVRRPNPNAANDEMLDSLSGVYQDVLKDKAVPEYFALGVVNNIMRGSTETNTKSGFSMIGMGLSPHAIIAEVLNVGRDQVVMPEALNEKFVTFCYKSTAHADPKIVADSLAKYLDLRRKVTRKKADFIQMEVRDTAKLYKYLADPEELGGSAAGNPDTLTIFNMPLPTLTGMLRERFSATVEFKNAKLYDRRLNLKAPVNTIDEFVQFMAAIGVKVEKQRRTVPVYTFSKI